MTLQDAQAVTRALVIATPLAWVAWDLFAMLRFGVEATESRYIWSVYRRCHWFALAVGLAGVALFWHFFLQ